MPACCLRACSGGFPSESEAGAGSGTDGAVDWPPVHVAQENSTTAPGMAVIQLHTLAVFWPSTVPSISLDIGRVYAVFA